MVRCESAVEYFKELVEGALAHQRVAATELTSFYIVQLLTGFLDRRTLAGGANDVRSDDEEPLALRLARALESGGMKQRVGLKQVGDQSLFISGFFSDSLRRKLVDVDYYVSIGGCAYHMLSQVETDGFAAVFAELGDKFVGFVDVLCEVSELSASTSNADLLRLYERWLRTGSPRSGQLLVERGVFPNASIRSSRVQ
jgi:hypothetical protein